MFFYYFHIHFLETQEDKILPSGSHVIMTGLADGRVLWDFMSQRIHPLGEYRSDVTYENVYEYLNCLETSPCHGKSYLLSFQPEY